MVARFNMIYQPLYKILNDFILNLEALNNKYIIQKFC